MIEVSPDVQLENLQPSRKRQGPIAQEPPRRSERIYAKLHPPAPAGPITWSMAKQGAITGISLFAYLEKDSQGAITGISSFAYLEKDSHDEITGTDSHKFHETSEFNNVDIIDKLENTQELFPNDRI